MKVIRIAFSELIGMFVDDGMLALCTVMLIAIVTALVELAGLSGLAGGALLLVGAIAILAESMIRASRRP